ncbi:DUF3794 domain-containing protein [Romboutsia weinsteinii]|uniref:DUF3794 domain-containing protein n=1 Tax=Romboutsia weinsteinii TaxID=2020949 RepID=A0A371IXH9_9FIRM|nr:DUF3794 domain-containing protein [Romboutsia weinsteinii]RDY25171.1 DUF3794 domain-containing protein [Romboutsia weinsteinii]
MIENISITGVTPLEKYPKSKCSKYYKQCLEDDILCIPHPKPDIDCINEVNASICVEKYDILNTVLGPKLIIHGVKNIKIIYIADNCQQSLHYAHWSIPFCEFILLKDLSYDECHSIIDNIFVGIENICIKHNNCRMIDMSLLFIICPQICDYNYCKCCKDYCYFNPNEYYSNVECSLESNNTCINCKNDICDRPNKKKYK